MPDLSPSRAGMRISSPLSAVSIGDVRQGLALISFKAILELSPNFGDGAAGQAAAVVG
jgi:hypothetical protein